MQYIAEYCNKLQCSTKGLRTRSKYASVILKMLSAVTHNTHVDDTQHQLNTLCNISKNRNVFVGNNRNTVFQYRATLIGTYVRLFLLPLWPTNMARAIVWMPTDVMASPRMPYLEIFTTSHCTSPTTPSRPAVCPSVSYTDIGKEQQKYHEIQPSVI